MNIMNFIQEIVLDNLKTNLQEINNIYVSPQRNSKYPYILLFIKKIEEKSNIDVKYYMANLTITIFDKNATNEYIQNVTQKIQDNIILVINLNNYKFKIEDINILETNFELFNELNLIWKNEIVINLLIKSNDN